MEPELPFEPLPHWLPAGARGFALALDGVVSGPADLPPALRGAPEGRRRATVAGRRCARQALRALGHEVGEIGRTDDGAPVWPAGVVGSITHTAHRAYAAVADGHDCGGLGIDSEVLLDADAARDVLAMCCSDGERRLAPPPGGLPTLPATVVFSAKEAFFKAVAGRLRRFIDFDEVQVSRIDWAAGGLCLQPMPGRGLPAASARFVLSAGEVHTTVALPSAGSTRAA